MKKKQNPNLLPFAGVLVVGILIGYGLAHFAPEIGAAIVRGRISTSSIKKPSAGGTSSVDQCKQNCDRAGNNASYTQGRTAYQKQNQNEAWSKDTHAWCEMNSKISASFSYVYLCHYHPSPPYNCGRFTDRYTNGAPEAFGFALDPNSDQNNPVWFQNCSIVESNRTLDPLNSNHFY